MAARKKTDSEAPKAIESKPDTVEPKPELVIAPKVRNLTRERIAEERNNSVAEAMVKD